MKVYSLSMASQAMKEWLQDNVGPDYLVLEDACFRLDFEIVAQPSLAVVARESYEREVMFRPTWQVWLNTVPLIAIEEQDPGRRRAAMYYTRGTAAVLVADLAAEPDAIAETPALGDHGNLTGAAFALRSAAAATAQLQTA